MNVSPRLATGRVFAIILALTLVLFGVNAVQLKAQSTNSNCPTATCQPEPEPTCCPVDPKEIHKAEKEAAHAAHEAEEDAARALKEAEHAQHEAAEDCARNQKKLAHAQHELAEEQEKVSELSNFCPADNTCPPKAAEAPVTEIFIERAKPEPEPVVEPTPEPAPAPLPEPAPVVTPAPEPPKELPKTASPMDLFGLIGLVSAAGYTTRFFRR